MEDKKNNLFENLKDKKWIKYLIISVIIFILFIIGLFFLFMPKIELVGDEELVLDYPNVYKEPGYKAKVLGKDITQTLITKK